jgi:hypothetical protein
MSLVRYAKKRDAAEGPIIEALERAGFEVWVLDRPCDLLIRKQHWSPGLFQALEVKKPKWRPRADQPEQNAFLERTQTPIVRTPLEALTLLGIAIEGA